MPSQNMAQSCKIFFSPFFRSQVEIPTNSIEWISSKHSLHFSCHVLSVFLQGPRRKANNNFYIWRLIHPFVCLSVCRTIHPSVITAWLAVRHPWSLLFGCLICTVFVACMPVWMHAIFVGLETDGSSFYYALGDFWSAYVSRIPSCLPKSVPCNISITCFQRWHFI